MSNFAVLYDACVLYPAPFANFFHIFALNLILKLNHQLINRSIACLPPSFQIRLLDTGERACPPEDVGGIPGYENFISIISNPKHKERKELLTWAGGKYDPERFDPKKVKFDNPKTRWRNAFT